ncbi:MAG: hypothetical protein EOP83_22505 [Verrucomicrobiaceae bacterium]|nr:MAG: hypothetical protein EOP83_22505 [Verrucomicrobiaceae bacterium]
MARPVTDVSEKMFRQVRFAFQSRLTGLHPIKFRGDGKLAKSKRQVLFFQTVKNEQSKNSYEIHTFDDDLNDFKPGSIRVINLSPKEVRFIMVGKEMPSVLPGWSAIYPQAKEVDEFGMDPMSVETKGDGDAWAKVYSASWKASERRREIAFVPYEERFQHWPVTLLGDDPPWTKAK